MENGVRTGVAGQATSSTALFLPGFTGSKEDFIAILEPLATAGQHAIAIDLAGQYESVGPAEIDHYSLAGFAADVLAVIAELPAPVDLVGHSMGGLVAQEAVLANPLSVRSLVLMDTGASALPPSHRQRMQLFAQVLAEHGLEVVWAAKQALEEAEGLSPPADPDIAQFLTDRFLASSPGSLLAMVDLLCNTPDRSDELATVAPATLVCFGEHDDAWSPAEQRRLAEIIKADVVMFAGVGHSPAAEHPAETVRALMDFWQHV